MNIGTLHFTVGKSEHGGMAYSNTIYIPQAKGKQVTFEHSYVLDGVGAEVTTHSVLVNVNGFIHAEFSYATGSDNTLGNVVQFNNVSIS
jgi:hypothetical protein